MIKQKPLVSVIMPVHNAGGFLVEAIESILNQTYKNLELVIVDDASTDDSWTAIKGFQKRFPRKIKAYRIRKQANFAGNGASNHGLKYTKGQFIARMDADDVAIPSRIEKQVNYLLKHPRTILVGTQAEVINANGETLGIKHVPQAHAEIYRQFGSIHPLIHPSTMIRRSLLPDRTKLYEDKYGVNDDYYTFFKFLSYGKFANLPEVLHKYRLHGKNASLTNLREKCLNTISIRLAAMRELGYRMPVSGYLHMGLQFLVAVILPEKILMQLYLTMRGLDKSPKRAFANMAFTPTKKYYSLSK
ncbi:MAG: Glycosyl transferase family 2 [Candidatus Gottesmanbacteria bacterium GW2011_GWB1_43_11]|uniref:Glycosyl transferase family 2 n=1 Tax=Candidatus Gottesmanbacteria bacterium GW2011_GWB1_43_11 TaxID=1618446 RepID=A0A0G1FEJ8_9BACT|nr:MAG: Glycosyl transferase family 2 [Candidatus Gottesmanbacteria bacterium GW2011_GWA2_42_16]KKS54431.1 MAG: Glycosyl transferase family 2 [Candidatus Gottesmanbacteria bacterium GW2011_GWA1_42_26]KKS80155.1 MAG: Glycosyl transferase family 2 [Candidatus Gottesmanbacteria bacterium GW2011_GWC1_43_10]KKS85273.1 MAG: Glycosyl transferase family 2 [Candidatus Gottesmanbacteria bacterium GW2011_GWB1_43_11]OGG10658.1 MAG: hypothetical protein A2699_02535 [Candidatus Gottesmanbacteria bacterium RI